MEKLIAALNDANAPKIKQNKISTDPSEGPHTEELKQENLRLHDVLSQLIAASRDNRATHQRFHRFELQLLSCTQLDSLLTQIVEGMIEQFELDTCSLWLYEEGTQLKQLLERVEFSHLAQNVRVVDDHQSLSSFYDNWHIQLIDNNHFFEKHAIFPGQTQIKSAALLPLIRNGLIVGSLHLGSIQQDRFAPGKGTDFLEHLSHIIAICLENAVHQHRLLHLSLIDMLTRAYNRRAFNEQLEKELSRAHRLKHPLSLLFMDIDYFKMVNDSYGHAMGDLALKEVARISQKHLRAVDMFARYGGEEFTALLPNTDHKLAIQIADRIRQTIKTSPIIDQDKILRVTVSIGVSTWRNYEAYRKSPGKIMSDLVGTADQALYIAKQHGRDQVRYLGFS